MRWKVLIWLIVLVVLTTGCGAGPAKSPASARGDGPVALAEARGASIRFSLKGYAGAGIPTLTVLGADGFDWSGKVEKPVRQGDSITAMLPAERGPVRLIVEQVTYTWGLPDGTVVNGELLFHSPRFTDLDWQVTRTDNLVIYHVKKLGAEDTRSWEKALREVLAWTGTKRDRPLAVWVFPDIRTLNQWYGYDSTVIAGSWWKDVERLMVYHDANTSEREVTILHEMVHAMSSGEGPLWFEEGAAQLFEARKERLLQGKPSPRWLLKAQDLQDLQALARQQRIETANVTNQGQKPLNAYTVGVSVWLFVKRYHGETGVQKFFREGGKANGAKSALEDLFNKPLPAIWDDWNAYLRSPDLLRDWENP